MELYSLQSVFRQEGQSPIVVNANKVNRLETDLIENENFKIYRYNPADEYGLLNKCTNIMYNDFNFSIDNPYETQIIVPIKSGTIGVRSINKFIQKKRFGEVKGKIHPGDKIIMVRNNYEIGYFNGDIGVCLEITEEEYIVRLLCGEISVPKEYSDDIQLSYAITVHKSEGSEYDNVILVLPKNGILKKRLVFTAITRAKKNIVIFSENDALENAIKRNVDDKRTSGLRDYLESVF